MKDILTLHKALTTSFGTNSTSFSGSILWNSTTDMIKSSNTAFLSKALKTRLLKYAIAVVVNTFVTFCNYKKISVGWYLLVLLISIKNHVIQL